MVTIVILNTYFDSSSCGNRETANLSQGQSSNPIMPAGWGLQRGVIPFSRVLDAYGRDQPEFGYSNHSSENCDCHNSMLPLENKKSQSCSAKCIMQICTSSFWYCQGRTCRVSSLGKTCSHCYLLSLSFLQIFLPIKTFSPESKHNDSKQGWKYILKRA